MHKHFVCGPNIIFFLLAQTNSWLMSFWRKHWGVFPNTSHFHFHKLSAPPRPISPCHLARPPPCHPCDAILALCPSPLPCPLLRKKEEGVLQALPLQEALLQESPNWGVLSVIPKKIPFALLSHWCCLWGWKLLALQNNQAFITMVGFDCKSFDRILENFGPMFSSHMPFNALGIIVEFEYVRGRKRNVKPADCLGLVLVWTRTRGCWMFCSLFLDLSFLIFLSIYFSVFALSLRHFVMTPWQESQFPKRRR